MTVNFRSSALRRTYSDRVVSEGWRLWCADHLVPAGKNPRSPIVEVDPWAVWIGMKP